MSKGNFEEFLEALGAFESGKPSGDPEQYSAVNYVTGATGKYQFTQILMQDLNDIEDLPYYQNDTNLFDNVWDGEFLGKNGITSLESWKDNPAVQETGIRESFFTNYGYVNAVLSNNNIPTLDTTFLADNEDTKTIKFYKLNDERTDFLRDENGEPILNEDPELTQVNLSLSGIIAGAHLRGGFGVGEVITQLNGKDVVDFTDTTQFDVEYYTTFLYDEINTSIFKYINDFGDYDAQISNFDLASYGDAQNYVLYGTLNQNSIEGGNGNDKIYGLQENDTLTGLNGDDSLYGGAGSDQIFGGNGNDLIDGWYNSFETGQIDELTGGEGGDTFVLGDDTDGVYYLGDGYAKIQDFNFLKGDKLDLTGNWRDYSVSSISFNNSGKSSLKLNYKNDLIAEINFSLGLGKTASVSSNSSSLSQTMSVNSDSSSLSQTIDTTSDSVLDYTSILNII